jgi:hypothetical protein
MDCLTDAGQTHEFIASQEDLRKCCTAYMMEDWVRDTPLVDFDSFFDPSQIARQLRRPVPETATMEWYIWEMSTPGRWGGELEVRAMALRLGITIHVHSLSQRTRTYEPAGPSSCDIHIGSLDIGHYVSLLRVAKCSGWKEVQPVPSAWSSCGVQRHTFKHFDQGDFGLPGPSSIGRFAVQPAEIVRAVGGAQEVGYTEYQRNKGAKIGLSVAGNSGRPGGLVGGMPDTRGRTRIDTRAVRADHSTQEEDIVSRHGCTLWPQTTPPHRTACSNALFLASGG